MAPSIVYKSMLHRYTTDITDIELPELFTYPFHYTPHPLCRIAAEEVQRYIATRTEWHEELSMGKMFGVLVVESYGEVGYLAAFSGNLAGSNNHSYFVPAVYDMLQPDDFFRRGEADITAINLRIKELEHSDDYLTAKRHLAAMEQEYDITLKAIKERLAKGKELRRIAREEGTASEESLILASQRESAEAQREKRMAKERVEDAATALASLQQSIDHLKHERQHRSAKLQQEIFQQFRMLNAEGTERDLGELFAPTAQRIPPQVLVSAPHLSSCSMPTSMVCTLWPWQSSGGEHHPRARYANMVSSTGRATASASQYWNTCSKASVLSRTLL